MIEAICWDVGGVFSSRPWDAVASIAAEHGLETAAVAEAMFGPADVDSDHIWHRLERGEVSLAAAWPEMEAGVTHLGIGVTMREVFSRFGNDPQDRTVVTQTVRDLHATGIAMAIVTNNVREYADYKGRGWHSQVPMDLIDVIVDSSSLGIRKPSAAIYRHTLRELGVVAEATVFVDDTAANVAAARSEGMHGVVVGSDPGPAMLELRSLVAELS